MFNFSKSILALALIGFSITVFAIPAGLTAFDIEPFTKNATVQSNGKTSVRYTVTNNATASITDISITADWHSNGVNLSLSNDTCSGQTLAQASSCTFNIDISGKDQTSDFTIQPKVCGFNGLLCSQAASIYSVRLVQHSLPTRIYEVIFPLDDTTEEIVGININDTTDIIRSTFSNLGTDGPLALSPDGATVYLTHQNSDTTYSLLVFTVTKNSLSLTTRSYDLLYNEHALIIPGDIAITPDGKTLYITDSSYVGTGYPVYRIDLSSSDYTTAVAGISDNTTNGVAVNPKGIVISPDGQIVYLSTSNSAQNIIFSFQNFLTITDFNTIVRETDLSAIKTLLISPDGSTVYAAGQSSADNHPAAIEQYNVGTNFDLENTFLPTPNSNGIVNNAALSPDSKTISAIVNNSGTFALYSVYTATMTAPSATTFPYHIIFGIYNYNCLTYSPDGSTLSVLNYGETGNLTALLNPTSFSATATVNPAGEDLVMYSHTCGSFVN